MQIVKIMGGLGNQMFQAAFALALAKRFDTDVFLDLTYYYEMDIDAPFRPYLLSFYNVRMGIACESQIRACLAERLVRDSYLPAILRWLFKRDKYQTVSNLIIEPCPGIFDASVLKLRPDAVYKGYFQSEKYFKHIRNEILNAFSLQIPLNDKNEKMLKEIKDKNSVSLHVRRGDYVDLQDVHGLCSLEYYKKAMDYIAQNTENPHFFLFSDDIAWVIENLKSDYPCTVVDINTCEQGYFDIELMKNCKHNIVANSSFSWWGAWLNENPDKIVVSPAKWFAATDLYSDDIVPKDWIKIA